MLMFPNLLNTFFSLDVSELGFVVHCFELILEKSLNPEIFADILIRKTVGAGERN